MQVLFATKYCAEPLTTGMTIDAEELKDSLAQADLGYLGMPGSPAS